MTATTYDHLTEPPHRISGGGTTAWRFIVNGETSVRYATRFDAEHAYDEAIRAGHDELRLVMRAPRERFETTRRQFKLETERLERVPGMQLLGLRKSAADAEGVTTLEARLRRAS